jgi:hypothetical protein
MKETSNLNRTLSPLRGKTRGKGDQGSVDQSTPGSRKYERDLQYKPYIYQEERKPVSKGSADKPKRSNSLLKSKNFRNKHLSGFTNQLGDWRDTIFVYPKPNKPAYIGKHVYHIKPSPIFDPLLSNRERSSSKQRAEDVIERIDGKTARTSQNASKKKKTAEPSSGSGKRPTSNFTPEAETGTASLHVDSHTEQTLGSAGEKEATEVKEEEVITIEEIHAKEQGVESEGARKEEASPAEGGEAIPEGEVIVAMVSQDPVYMEGYDPVVVEEAPATQDETLETETAQAPVEPATDDGAKIDTQEKSEPTVDQVVPAEPSSIPEEEKTEAEKTEVAEPVAAKTEEPATVPENKDDDLEVVEVVENNKSLSLVDMDGSNGSNMEAKPDSVKETSNVPKGDNSAKESPYQSVKTVTDAKSELNKDADSYLDKVYETAGRDGPKSPTSVHSEPRDQGNEYKSQPVPPSHPPHPHPPTEKAQTPPQPAPQTPVPTAPQPPKTPSPAPPAETIQEPEVIQVPQVLQPATEQVDESVQEKPEAVVQAPVAEAEAPAPVPVPEPVPSPPQPAEPVPEQEILEPAIPVPVPAETEPELSTIPEPVPETPIPETQAPQTPEPVETEVSPPVPAPVPELPTPSEPLPVIPPPAEPEVTVITEAPALPPVLPPTPLPAPPPPAPPAPVDSLPTTPEDSPLPPPAPPAEPPAPPAPATEAPSPAPSPAAPPQPPSPPAAPQEDPILVEDHQETEANQAQPPPPPCPPGPVPDPQPVTPPPPPAPPGMMPPPPPPPMA